MHHKTDDPYTYYNWQFLRRNKKYRTEYDRYTALLKTDESKADKMLINLVKKWGMSSYVDWRDEVPDFLPNLFFDPLAYLGHFSYEELTGSKNPIDDFVELQPGKIKKRRFLLMALDLENIRSKDYDRFWETIAALQKKYDLKAKTQKIERVVSKRKHLDKLLATYDEYDKDTSATYHQIAKKLLRLYLDKTSNTASTKPNHFSKEVKKNIERAKALIELAPNIPFDFSKEIERI